jgi:hypothetical protein
METYKASLNITSKIITGFIFLPAIFGVALMLTLQPWYGGLFVFVLSFIILFWSYLYWVRCYQISDTRLIIKRPFTKFDKVILLSEIKSVKLLTKEDMKGTLRTGGNGGLFGYSGYFTNNKLGTFTVYATNSKNRLMLFLATGNNKIVISPDDAGMADALQMRLKNPT